MNIDKPGRQESSKNFGEDEYPDIPIDKLGSTTIRTNALRNTASDSDKEPDGISVGIMNNTFEQMAILRARLRFQIHGQGVTIAILDSGVSKLANFLNIDEGWNFNGRSGEEFDADHGTALAGWSVGTRRFPGVAPKATVSPYGIMLNGSISGGSKFTSSVESAMRHLSTRARNGETIVAIASFGIGPGARPEDLSPTLCSAINEAIESGILVMTSAGNYGGNCGPESTIYWFKTLKNICVTTVATEYPRLWNGASRGPGSPLSLPHSETAPKPDLTAIIHSNGPILSQNGEVRFGFGRTSGANAIAAGCAALVRSANPALKPSAVIEILKSTATPRGRQCEWGAGIINCEKAIELAVNLKSQNAHAGSS